MKGRETIGANGSRVLRLLDGLNSIGVGKRNKRMVDGLLMDFTGGLPGVGIVTVSRRTGILLIKVFGDFTFPS